jgi:hypothetical protein
MWKNSKMYSRSWKERKKCSRAEFNFWSVLDTLSHDSVRTSQLWPECIVVLTVGQLTLLLAHLVGSQLTADRSQTDAFNINITVTNRYCHLYTNWWCSTVLLIKHKYETGFSSKWLVIVLDGSPKNFFKISSPKFELSILLVGISEICRWILI